MREPLPAHERAAILDRVAGSSPSATTRSARTICAEAGKPLKAARVEASRAVSTYTMAAVEARKLAGDALPMDASPAGEGKLAFTLRVPIGIVGAISPFNFPLNLVAHKIAPALAAGCAVVLKPAAQTPLSALLLAELELEAGLPPGWLNVVCGPASEIGDVLVEDERVKLITFTGSVAHRLEDPRARLAQAGQPRARERDAGHRRRGCRPRRRGGSPRRECVLLRRAELHLRPADLRRASRPTTRSWSASSPASRRCEVGDPADETTDVGPLIAQSERDRILAWIEEAQGLRGRGPHRRDARRPTAPPDGDRERAPRTRRSRARRSSGRSASSRRTTRSTRRSRSRTGRGSASRPGSSRPT